MCCKTRGSAGSPLPTLQRSPCSPCPRGTHMWQPLGAKTSRSRSMLSFHLCQEAQGAGRGSGETLAVRPLHKGRSQHASTTSKQRCSSCLRRHAACRLLGPGLRHHSHPGESRQCSADSPGGPRRGRW